MTKSLRHAALGLLATLGASLASPAAFSADVPAPGASPAVDAVKSEGVLRVGVVVLPPWVVQDPATSQYIGPAPSVAQGVAKALGVKIEFVPATWDTIVAGLLSKKYQIAGAALFETPQREKVIDFATYDRAGTCYAVRADSNIKTLADLNNPNLNYLGYTGEATDTLFHEAYPTTKINQISPPPGAGPRVPDLLNNRGDIASIDSPMVFLTKDRWPNVRIIPDAQDCFDHPDLAKDIGLGYGKGDAAFGALIKSVIEENKDEIKKELVEYSQPKWVQ